MIHDEPGLVLLGPMSGRTINPGRLRQPSTTELPQEVKLAADLLGLHYENPPTRAAVCGLRHYIFNTAYLRKQGDFRELQQQYPEIKQPTDLIGKDVTVPFCREVGKVSGLAGKNNGLLEVKTNERTLRVLYCQVSLINE